MVVHSNHYNKVDLDGLINKMIYVYYYSDLTDLANYFCDLFLVISIDAFELHSQLLELAQLVTVAD